MDYFQHYYNLTSRAGKFRPKRRRNKIFHGHHIIPKCMIPEEFWDDERNIVYLTPRAHFIAHKLLMKIYPHCSSLQETLWFMVNVNGHKVSSREYERRRGEYIERLRKRMSSKENIEKLRQWNENRVFTEKHRENLSKSGKRYYAKHTHHGLGVKLSEQHKKKIGDGQRGCVLDDKTRERMSESKTKIHEKERREILRMHQKGEPRCEIAKKFQISESSVCRILRQLTGKEGKHLLLYKVLPEDRVKILKMREGGMPAKDIANQFNIAVSTVYYVARLARKKLKGEWE